MDQEIVKKKKFDSKLYYQLNKERINAYNKNYWHLYYNKGKINKTEKKPKGITSHFCIIKRNVVLTF